MVLYIMQKLVHAAYCGLCHQSAVYYMIVESRPYVKLFRLITLIPTLLLILQCLLPPKEASFAMLLFGGEVTDVESDEGEKGEVDTEI